jgi:DNA-binding transcriptional ArsR family regulator
VTDAERFARALEHPLRRRILRSAAERDEAQSPSQTSSLYDIHISNVSYHYRVLVEADLLELAYTRPVRGAAEHFYRPVPAALDHPLVKGALDEVPG